MKPPRHSPFFLRAEVSFNVRKSLQRGPKRWPMLLVALGLVALACAGMLYLSSPRLPQYRTQYVKPHTVQAKVVGSESGMVNLEVSKGQVRKRYRVRKIGEDLFIEGQAPPEPAPWWKWPWSKSNNQNRDYQTTKKGATQ